MRAGTHRSPAAWLTLIAAIVTALGILAPSASAQSGEWAKFQYCPASNAEVFKCIYSVTTGGEVVLGKKTVPIVNPVPLQGGISEPGAGGVSKFFAATNGVTLAPVPQPVPGGLAGLVNCKEISLGWLRTACEAVFENGLTGVNATLELAKPAADIGFNELAILYEQGVGLKLPVRVHLENPLLGSSCFIGSSSEPLIWNLTTGATTPPPPTASIHGTSGTIKFIEEGEIIELGGTRLVENDWKAPGANGCGGWPAEYILDPIINASVGVPSEAGKNKAVLQNTSLIALGESVLEH